MNGGLMGLNVKKTKACQKCGEQRLETDFVKVNFEFSPKAKNCVDCFIKQIELDLSNEVQENYESDILLVYGVQLANPQDWLTYVAPGTYYRIQRRNESECLYCGIKWGVHYDKDKRDIIVITPDTEHMDPQVLGGANTPVNIAFSCPKCNSSKGAKPFSEWLKQLPNDRARLALEYYKQRHKREPSEFEPTEYFKKHGTTEMYESNYLDLIKDQRILNSFSPIMITKDVPLSERPRVEREVKETIKLRTLMTEEAKEKFQNFPWLIK